jgi:hypothetical protein
MIVPSGIATDDTTKEFFHELVETRALTSFFEFENNGFFMGIGQGHMVRFALVTLSGRNLRNKSGEFLFRGQSIGELADGDRRLSLTPNDFVLMNPNTLTSPIFRTRRDATIARGVYTRVPILVNESIPLGGPWRANFRQGLFNMASDSAVFATREELEVEGWLLKGNTFERDEGRYLPLYESKMVHQFTHRYGDHGLLSTRESGHVLPQPADAQLADPAYVPMPRYWVSQSEVERRLEGRAATGWLIGWRDVTDARASARTVVACVLPRVGIGHNLPLLFPGVEPQQVACLVGALNSLALDYVARQKVAGLHLTFFIISQLPVLAPEIFEQSAPWDRPVTTRDWIAQRVLELTYTADDLAGFARDLGWYGAPFRWDPERRELLRAELDAAFFHLYGVVRDDVEYVLSTFPVVRRSEERTHGEFRTKRLVLERYDALAKATEMGQAYEGPLDPPPGDSRATHLAARTT